MSIKFPEKKNVCSNFWHYGTPRPPAPRPRSCPECKGIESLVGIECNKTWNVALDATKELNKASRELEPLDENDLRKFLQSENIPMAGGISRIICSRFGSTGNGGLKLREMSRYEIAEVLRQMPCTCNTMYQGDREIIADFIADTFGQSTLEKADANTYQCSCGIGLSCRVHPNTPAKKNLSVEDIVRVFSDHYATCDDAECNYCSICANKTAEAIHALIAGKER